MSRTKEFWFEQDFEREHLTDYIFQKERELEMEHSYLEWQKKQKVKLRKIIIKNETKHKRTSFRRAYKKILQFRSHLYAKNGRTETRLIRV